MSEQVVPLPQSEAEVSGVLLPDTQQLKRVLETALLTATEPLSLPELKKLCDEPMDNRQIETILEELA